MDGDRCDRARGPRCNRVTPSGDVTAIELRGAWTGNRGILHRSDRDGTDRDGAEIVRHHVGIAWIVCVLQFRGRRVPQWAPGHYTPLFFQDEAVALAAGHRPCAECRRPAFRAFTQGIRPGDPPRAPELDRLLHDQRWRPRQGRRRHERSWAGLPDGAFVVVDDSVAVVLGDAVVPWTVHGYRPPTRRPTGGTTMVLTPPVSLAALAAGYPVQVDPTASALAGQILSSTAGSSSSTER